MTNGPATKVRKSSHDVGGGDNSRMINNDQEKKRICRRGDCRREGEREERKEKRSMKKPSQLRKEDPGRKQETSLLE